MESFKEVVGVLDSALLLAILHKQGRRKQLDQLQEELCECAAEISRERRNRPDSNPPKEIGDVLMMIAQAIMIYGVPKIKLACAESQEKARKHLYNGDFDYER